MKKLILTILLLTSVSVNASPTFYDEPDKVLHTRYSALGAHALYAVGATPEQSFWTMMGIGVVKELTDNNSTREGLKDIVANAAGAVTVFAYKIKF